VLVLLGGSPLRGRVKGGGNEGDLGGGLLLVLVLLASAGGAVGRVERELEVGWRRACRVASSAMMLLLVVHLHILPFLIFPLITLLGRLLLLLWLSATVSAGEGVSDVTNVGSGDSGDWGLGGIRGGARNNDNDRGRCRLLLTGGQDLPGRGHAVLKEPLFVLGVDIGVGVARGGGG